MNFITGNVSFLIYEARTVALDILDSSTLLGVLGGKITACHFFAITLEPLEIQQGRLVIFPESD
jgi:hypothetical protein